MQTIRIIIGLGIAALAVYFAIQVLVLYKKATGTVWQRLLCAGHDSMTMLWGKFCLVLAGIVGNLDSIADALGMPEVKAWVDTVLGNPKVVASFVVVVSLVTMAARARRGSSDPIVKG